MKTFQNTKSGAPSSEQISFLDHVKAFLSNTTCFTIESIKETFHSIWTSKFLGADTPTVHEYFS